MINFDCPDLVILDVSMTLPRLRECLYRSYEHLPDGPSNMAIEEEIYNSIERVMQCLEMRDTAKQNLHDMVEEQFQHDVDFDQVEYKFAICMQEFGRDLLNQFNRLGMYYSGDYLPFFYREQLGNDAIILQRVGSPEYPNE